MANNFQVDRNKKKNSVNLFEKGHHRQKTQQGKSEKMMEGIARWTSFYRANPHRFVRECLGIELKLFQQIILWCMFHFNYLAYIASRGQGKSYLVGIYCITRAILYPDSEIVAAAGQKSQAREIIQKIEKERLRSPFIEREIMKINTSVNDSSVVFHNGSIIRTVASNDGARGKKTR